MEEVASWAHTGVMVTVKEEVKEETVEMEEVEVRLEVGSDISSSAIIVKEEGDVREGEKEEGEEMETETEEGEEVWLEVGSDITSSAITISSSEGSDDPIIKEEVGVTPGAPP